MSEETQWLPAIAVLLAGVVFGIILVVRGRKSSQRRQSETLAEKDVRADLEQRFAARIEELRNLEAESSMLTPEQLSSERARLEREAAVLLREIQQQKQQPERATGRIDPAPVPVPGGRGFLAERPALKGLVWITGVVTIGAVLYVLLLDTTTLREQGGSLTGSLPERATRSVQADPELTSLISAVERDPQNHELRVDLARALFERRDLMQVFQQTQFVLERHPEHPRALAYQAIVRLAMGDSEEALQMVERAVERDPDLLEGLVHLAIVNFQLGRLDDARSALASARSRHPDRAAMLETLEREMFASGVASDGTAPPAAAPIPRDAAFAGRITLPDGMAAGLTEGATLFVMVRPAGQAAGPPIAVKRIPVRSFPVDFAITPGDSMQGIALPATARLEARLDADGDAFTRSDADLSAVIESVPIGSTNLILTLQR
jgi:tetratricopeptide (TPR) repeat protein